MVSKQLTQEHKDNIAKAMCGKKNCLGNKLSKEHKASIRNTLTGRKIPLETREKMSESHKGEKSHYWKDGRTPLTKNIRDSLKYIQWRSKVFNRDSFTCVVCHKVGGRLNAHHIKLFSTILDEYKIKTFKDAQNCKELWNINNGVTLCLKCHKQIHKVNNNGNR